MSNPTATVEFGSLWGRHLVKFDEDVTQDVRDAMRPWFDHPETEERVETVLLNSGEEPTAVVNARVYLSLALIRFMGISVRPPADLPSNDLVSDLIRSFEESVVYADGRRVNSWFDWTQADSVQVTVTTLRTEKNKTVYTGEVIHLTITSDTATLALKREWTRASFTAPTGLDIDYLVGTSRLKLRGSTGFWIAAFSVADDRGRGLAVMKTCFQELIEKNLK